MLKLDFIFFEFVGYDIIFVVISEIYLDDIINNLV